MKGATIIFAVICSFFAVVLGAPSKLKGQDQHTSMQMHHTETPHMMASEASPEPEPESEPTVAPAKQMNEKTDTVSMAPHMEGGMMASTAPTNMMHEGHANHTESSMKQDMGHHDHKGSKHNHEQKDGKIKNH